MPTDAFFLLALVFRRVFQSLFQLFLGFPVADFSVGRVDQAHIGGDVAGCEHRVSRDYRHLAASHLLKVAYLKSEKKFENRTISAEGVLLYYGGHKVYLQNKHRTI